MNKSLLKDSIKEIIKTYKRFISILLMAFLGVGFFAGVRATSPDMELTLDKYFDKNNVYDINVISTLGLTDEDVNAISKIDGVQKAIGIYSEDVYISFDDEEIVVKVYELEEEINNLEIIEGNLPTNSDECVIEEKMKTVKEVSVGDYIEIKEELEEDEDSSFEHTKLKVVGVIKSPLYISADRGTTTLGAGKLAYYMYVNKNNIKSDVFTEVDIIAKNAKGISTLDEKYESLIENVKDNLENIKSERQIARYNELIAEANQKLDDAQTEFDTEKADAEKKIADAEKEIADGKKDIADAEKEIANGEKELQDARNKANTEFANAEVKLGDAQNQIILSQEALDDAKIYFEAKKNEVEAGKTQLQTGIQTLETTINNLNENKSLVESVLSGIAKIDETLNMLEKQIEQYQSQIANSTEDTTELKMAIQNLETQILNLNNEKNNLLGYGITTQQLDEINSGIAECNAQKIELENQLITIENEITKGENELIENQNKLNLAWNEVQSGKVELAKNKQDAEKEFAEAEKKIADSKKELADAKKELEDGEKELEEKKIEFNTEIADAEEKLIDAREKVNDIEIAKWYIWDRYENSGFNSFSQDTENIERLGEAFPIVFFIIATLISLTSMTRMVEEQRVQIGTLKALGYNKLQIMSKYIIYSLLASAIGGFLGAVFGLQFFPAVIMSMYQMMYNMTDLVIEFNTYYTVLGIGIMCLCIVGATIYTANKELSSTPAEMMRPKSPKAGKRVLLEKIPFLWKRFNFTQKVTLRNMFRYKKRFLMTVIGIMGCTALILAGFGLKDSVSKIMDYQYIDIYDYDMMISLKNTLTDDEIQSLKTELENNEQIKKCVEVYMSSDSVKNKEFEEDAQIVVTNNPDELNEVIRLKELKTGGKLSLNDNGVIITDKLAQLVDAKVGDEIILCDSDENEYKVKVEGITEHYISHYVYMTESLYQKIFNKEISTNIFLTQYSKELSDEEENNLSEEILLNSKVMAITLTEYLMGMMNDTLNALNLVVYILIASAGLLAFIVLFNLSNVNISERIRELATIKVLGFYDKEVYNYVTREIVLLTVIGIGVGLIFGNVLNSFILGTCEIGMLRFKKIILPQSYIYSALITIIFTYIINIMTYFSLKKIDMIESLKSVE